MISSVHKTPSDPSPWPSREPALAACLRPTETIDSDHPAVEAFARGAIGGASGERERAVRLFESVRDVIAYDPYCCHVTTQALRASNTLARRRGWCVPKAVLLAACARAVGIPARLGFADVENHLSTEKLRQLMGSNVYAWHGWATLLIEGRWLKATPAFNSRLCRVFGFLPVEFDGRSDSLLHPTDARGRRSIEYQGGRGEFEDTPVELIRETFDRDYPALVAESRRRWEASLREGSRGGGDAFERDGERERERGGEPSGA